MTPAKAASHGWKINQDGRSRTALEYLAHPGIGFDALASVWPDLAGTPPDLVRRMEAEALYAGYLPRQAEDAAALRRDESIGIPEGFDFASVGGLSNEVRTRLEHARPVSVGAAARLEGVTPGALTALLASLRSRRQQSA
jgi:tRNA uridine 5-carboxymethylaminomethyl modification enzyme